MKNKVKFLGFTLIELLLVIAIAGILSVMGLSMMKQNAQEAKIEKTILQMQLILQAGMAYYVDNGCWPQIIGASPGCTAAPLPYFTSYIPASVTVNPWGYSYIYQTPYDPTPSATRSNIFEVAVDVPNQIIANRIAAALPNAVAIPPIANPTRCPSTAYNCAVLAEINVPAQFYAKNYAKPYATLVAAGNISTGTSSITALSYPTSVSVNFTCPPGSKDAKAIVSPSKITYYPGDLSVSPTQDAPAYPQAMLISSSRATDASCPADTNGFITHCAMNMTLSVGMGQVCAASDNLNYDPCGPLHVLCPPYRMELFCWYPLYDAGASPSPVGANIQSFAFQYQIYCCPTSSCFAETNI